MIHLEPRDPIDALAKATVEAYALGLNVGLEKAAKTCDEWAFLAEQQFRVEGADACTTLAREIRALKTEPPKCSPQS